MVLLPFVKNKNQNKQTKNSLTFTENEAVPHQKKVDNETVLEVMLKFENNKPKYVVPLLTLEYS